MKTVLLGFGYDDYKVMTNRLYNPYTYRELIFSPDNKNVKVVDNFIYFNYSQSKPEFHSKIYFNGVKPSEFLLKEKFEICNDINSADIIVDDSVFSCSFINMDLIVDKSQKKVCVVEPEFSNIKGIHVDFPNRLLELVISGKCVKPIYKNIDILKYCETPENDLTPEICLEIEKMLKSNDIDARDLGLMTLFSMNVLTFPKITEYFLKLESRSIYEYPPEIGYMTSYVHKSLEFDPYVSQKELSLIYKFFSKKTNSPEILIRNTFNFSIMEKDEISYYIDYDDKDFWNKL